MALMNEQRDTAIATLAATPRIIRSIVGAIPADIVTLPEGDAANDAWSISDIIAHVVLTGRMGAISRIRSVVTEDDPLLLNHDEEAELAASGLRTKSADELLRMFSEERARDIAWLRGLDDAAFARTGRHSVAGQVTAGEFLQHAAYHDCLHIAQMISMAQAHFEPLRGAMRMF